VQGFAITTGKPIDDRIGSLALRGLAIPFTRATGKTPQLLARGIFSVTCLLLLAGPASGGGYARDMLGNGINMLIILLLFWMGLKLSWQIESLARGCDVDRVPFELLATGQRFARNRAIWGFLLVLEALLSATRHFQTVDLFDVLGLAFLVLGSYVVTCVVIPQARKKRARLPFRLSLLPSLARVRS
jgi:hypothetical protein